MKRRAHTHRNPTPSAVKLPERHGFTPKYVESEGGHTWLNWRDYPSQFAPLLFQ